MNPYTTYLSEHSHFKSYFWFYTVKLRLRPRVPNGDDLPVILLVGAVSLGSVCNGTGGKAEWDGY